MIISSGGFKNKHTFGFKKKIRKSFGLNFENNPIDKRCMEMFFFEHRNASQAPMVKKVEKNHAN